MSRRDGIAATQRRRSRIEKALRSCEYAFDAGTEDMGRLVLAFGWEADQAYYMTELELL